MDEGGGELNAFASGALIITNYSIDSIPFHSKPLIRVKAEIRSHHHHPSIYKPSKMVCWSLSVTDSFLSPP